MLGRRKTKRLLKAEEDFKTVVTNYIVGLGARPGRFYQFEMDTPAGLLYLSVYEDWLATRFDDVKRGTAFTQTCGQSSNPYSGKWNFHFGDGTTGSLASEAVMPYLDDQFDLLMHWEPTAQKVG